MKAPNPFKSEQRRRDLERKYQGDQQGFLAAEAGEIIMGRIKGRITDAHWEAYMIEQTAPLRDLPKPQHKPF